MKEGSVIVNHTSAIGLNPKSDMIVHSAASTGFLVASMAFSVSFCHARDGGWRPLFPDTVTCPKKGATRDRGSNRRRCSAATLGHSKNKYFKKTKIRMTTLCSELFPSTFVGGTVPPITCDGQEARKNIQISIAKSAAYLVEHGSNNTLWLCQQNGILSMVELQKIIHVQPNKLRGHVITMECFEKLIKKDWLHPLNGEKLTEKDIIPLQRGGTGYATTNVNLQGKNARPVLQA
ncbi:nitric oxide synthase-interacting protein [Aphis craccivora]|uniref:Nitric oxide synthase-interacting protein n=1 Tax=Aphis craccivora TaxID=307492 RepID=A0A6G0VV71_APHCR|nr:nitric oxide synthase-interacting protein [Aphis craccivora]